MLELVVITGAHRAFRVRFPCSVTASPSAQTDPLPPEAGSQPANIYPNLVNEFAVKFVDTPFEMF